MEHNQDIAPVILTQREIAQSEEKRAKKSRSVTQTPVYRAASNLAYFVTEIIMSSPKKLRVSAENLDALCNELLRALTFAYDSQEGRQDALTDALSLARVILTRISVFFKLGYVSKDTFNKSKKMANSLFAQIAAWRASASGQRSVV